MVAYVASSELGRGLRQRGGPRAGDDDAVVPAVAAHAGVAVVAATLNKTESSILRRTLGRRVLNLRPPHVGVGHPGDVEGGCGGGAPADPAVSALLPHADVLPLVGQVLAAGEVVRAHGAVVCGAVEVLRAARRRQIVVVAVVLVNLIIMGLD